VGTNKIVFVLINPSFYTRLFKIKDPITGQPVFSQLQVTLVCEQCKEDGLAAQCKHMLHLVPQWQSSARHERLKEVMADRPDLIQSELAVISTFQNMRICEQDNHKDLQLIYFESGVGI
jgi:hypothetical protein